MRWPKEYGFALAVCLLLAFFPIAMPSSYKIDETKSVLFENFPYQMGEWTGQDSDVDERTYEILETRNVLSRSYVKADGSYAHLLLVSSKRDRRVAHPPEVCYTGSHYSIVQSADDFVRTDSGEIPVRSFVAESEQNPEYREQVIYLYKIGNQYTTNYYAQQLRFAMDKISNKESEVLLIRVSSLSKDVSKSFLKEVLEVVQS